MGGLRAGFVIALVLGLGLIGQPHSAEALPAPTQPGPVVLEDPLSSPGVAQLVSCPSQRNAGGFQGGAYFLAVTGRCQPASIGASMSFQIEGLTLADGEVAIGTSLMAGPERARFNLIIREQSVWSSGSYAAQVDLGRGAAELVRWTDEQVTVLTERHDLAGLLSISSLNRIVVRAQGPTFWLLINDQPVLTASDSTYGTGTVRVQLARVGNLDDDQPVMVFVQDLRVAALEGSDTALRPVYRRPGYLQRTAYGPGRAAPDEGRQHLSPGSKPTYVNNPPTSGQHYSTWTRSGVYPEPIKEGYWVHSLEHGYVVLLYNCTDCPDLVQQLGEFYETAPPSERYGYQKLIVMPWPYMSQHLVALAWDRIDELDDFDAARLTAFLEAYQDRGPEEAP